MDSNANQGSLSTINVEDTNLESLQSKSSIITAGYRSDPFLLHIVSDVKKRRSPSINLGYFARNLALEFSFEKALLHFSNKNAGLLSPDSCLYIEADLPRVVKRKCEMIKSSDILKTPFGNDNKMSIFPDGSFKVGKGFVNIACDLRDLVAFRSKLISVAGIDFEATTVFLCECSLTYVDPKYTTRFFFAWSKKSFSDAVFINYEQIRPFDRFGNIMTSHFEKRQTPLLNVKVFPTLESHITRFKELGWPVVAAKDLTYIWKEYLTNVDKDLIQNSSDCFDEFEELVLKCNHYILLIARSKDLPLDEIFPRFEKNMVENCNNTVSIIPPLLEKKNEQTECFERYGHSVHITSKGVAIVGGFSNHNSRDCAVSVVNSSSMEVLSFTKNVIPINCSLYHAGDILKDDNLLIFGGRSSPGKPSNDLVHILLQEKDSICCKVFLKKSTTPLPRWKHTFTRVDDKTFILIGVEKDVWELFPIACPFGLFSHSANRWKDRIVVSGGMTDLNTFNKDLIFIDPINKSLYVESFHNKVPQLFSHSSHILQNELWLIGGVSPHTEPAIILIDLVKHSVTHFAYSFVSDAKLTFNHGSFVNEDGDFILIGGGGNCFSFGKRINNHPLLLLKPK
ncbi:PPM2 [Lepeophtheirus salmonis]|uniref:tRNA wybutosine-synthesizing protein 4 n=1 Tax=Lepeophtheirus salmonis TaxID=72036 RepID=A0A7R8CI05_LEPSM|nr:PPM2 [Lepeophtheirus salmonis]CAF2828391.1 PPM2 [Lepeophtheirus salmonis]